MKPNEYILAEFIVGDKDRSERVQLAKTGTFNHASYGVFSITPLDLYAMKANFEKNARKQKIEDKPVIPFDYKHDSEDKAAGWIDNLFIEDDKNGAASLFGSVDWTPEAAKKIREKEFAFVSPDICRNYKDSETGQNFDVVLKGAALTNIPFLRDMEAIYLLSEDKQKEFMSIFKSGDSQDTTKNSGAEMTIEDIMSALAQMSPEEKKKVFEMLAKDYESEMMGENKELATQLSEVQKELETAKTDLGKAQESLKLAEGKKGDDTELEKSLKLSEEKVQTLSEKLESVVQKLAETERGQEFDQMLSEGKVCEAQREPFMKSDFAAFAAAHETLNLDEKGHGEGEGEAEAKLAEKVDALAEEKIKADKDLDYADAVSMVLSENPKLKQAYLRG